MPNFIDKLSEQVRSKRDELRATLNRDATPEERKLQKLVRENWHPLPNGLVAASRRPAFAVDGSIGQAHLANGAYLFAAQALLLGEGLEETMVDVKILRGSTPRSSVERVADLLLQRLEVGLARDHASRIPSGGVLFLDGALYGQLPQLYPLNIEGIPDPLPEDTLAAYLDLFRQCRERGVLLISVAKTSREATHSKIWLGEHEQQTSGSSTLFDIPDSEMIYRWTDERAGYSTPVILGKRGFTRGSQELLRREEMRPAPAIVSFFVRLADHDDAVRIDTPAFCVGQDRRLVDLEGEILVDTPELSPILEALAVDYGGLEVYNALLYTVDRQVRLERSRMIDVYLPLIRDIADCEIRLDRSERRFA
jgi:hypothetical protein